MASTPLICPVNSTVYVKFLGINVIIAGIGTGSAIGPGDVIIIARFSPEKVRLISIAGTNR